MKVLTNWKHVWPLAFGLVVFLSSASSAAAANKYHTHTFGIPAGFDTLEDFVKDTFGQALDDSSFKSTNIDGRPAISFSTEEAGIRQFNLLIQEPSSLTLMTSANLEIMEDTEGINGAASPTIPTDIPSAAVPRLTIDQLYPGACGSKANGGNCVSYVRCLAPWLSKTDLTTFVAKKKLINSQIPQIGAVAVIQVSGTFAINGHLAYIIGTGRDSRGNITIQISESNYFYHPGFDIRTGTPASMNVVGYIVQR